MKIINAHIREAEAFLIGGNHFEEDERVPFIKNLETCDLLAVPGSGKTTALQAKLYCLARQMPFADGSSVLVLSHTNKAVEEIENTLKDHCPQLFQYPNFVGTVQSFVNEYIANSGCYELFGSYIHINDKDWYEIEAEKFYHSLPWKNTQPKGLRNKLFGRINQGDNKLTFNKKENKVINFLKNFELDLINRKIINYNTTIYKYEGESQQYYTEIETWKKSLYSKGVLNFKDSFNIANAFMIHHNELHSILQKRFKYVFIDEAQDLEQYQLDIIESVFNTEDSECVIQRIGDINQSIYNGGKSVKDECDWQPRKRRMYLTKSYRLTSEIANIVDYFALDKRDVDDIGKSRFSVDGVRKLDNPIPPYLIVFDKDSSNKLIPKFKELITSNNLYDGVDGHNTKNGFKVIGWSGTWKDEDSNGKLRLENLFPAEYKQTKSQQSIKNKLCDYLIYYPNETTLRKYQTNIMAAFCAILSLAECKMTTIRNGLVIEKYFTDYFLWKKLNNESRLYGGILSEEDLLEFQSKLFSWSFSVATYQNVESAYNSIKDFVINTLSQWFNFEVSESIQRFLGEKYEPTIINVPAFPQIDNTPHIDVCSVHSVKGQTHCATMYIETSYHNYETEKKQIIDILQKKPHTLLSAKNVKRSIEATKMMYVGFSRPTHLLCFAVLSNNLSEDQLSYFQDIKNGWNYIDLSKSQ